MPSSKGKFFVNNYNFFLNMSSTGTQTDNEASDQLTDRHTEGTKGK